jgi:hypothetical protein
MAGLGGLLGNPTLQQLLIWQVGAQIIGSALGPYLTALQVQVNSASPLALLSPELAAEAVLRNVWPRDRAAAEARGGGVSGERFDVLARLAGNAPDPTSLAVALRRKLISPERYLDGIRQGRLRDEWADVVRELAVHEPGPEAPLAALLQGQLPEGRARELYARFGGDPEHFDWLFDTQGQAPTPTQALELANRGIIPWAGEGPDATSFRQAFLEGPWRNKWEPAFRALGEYLPPPRTVTAMFNEGSIGRGRAIELLQKQGLAPDLAAAYISSGSAQRTAPTRDLARTTIEALYRDRLIGRGQAADALVGMGYDAEEADLLLQVVDVAVAQRFLTAAVGRIRSLYVGHKLDRPAAMAILAQLDVPPDNVTDLLSIWDLEEAANVRPLTPAQVAAALRATFIDQATAQAMLEGQGYQPFDAWLLLSLAAKQALPGRPAPSAITPPPGP